MTSPLLSEKERIALQAFVDRSQPETAYLRRAKIVLMADEGSTQEAIAVDTGVAIIHVRQMLRAFNRQGIAFFPAGILTPPSISPDAAIAETGRQILARLLTKVEAHLNDLETTTTVTAA